MEGQSNFPRRLKQFDGLTWLTLTPDFTTDLRHWQYKPVINSKKPLIVSVSYDWWACRARVSSLPWTNSRTKKFAGLRRECCDWRKTRWSDSFSQRPTTSTKSSLPFWTTRSFEVSTLFKLLGSATENPFRKMQSPDHHCLHTLLAPDRPLSNILWTRGHEFELPRCSLICMNDLSSLTVCLNLLIRELMHCQL